MPHTDEHQMYSEMTCPDCEYEQRELFIKAQQTMAMATLGIMSNFHAIDKDEVLDALATDTVSIQRILG